MRYLIGETLEETTETQFSAQRQYVAVITPHEWANHHDEFDLGIDIDPEFSALVDMQAEENFDAITGVIRKPDLMNLETDGDKFWFALDEKGIVFVDSTGVAQEAVETLRATRRWRNPSLERFIYEFLLQISADAAPFMTQIERELDATERHLRRRSNRRAGGTRERHP